jgi:hypothetical protein
LLFFWPFFAEIEQNKLVLHFEHSTGTFCASRVQELG